MVNKLVYRSSLAKNWRTDLLMWFYGTRLGFHEVMNWRCLGSRAILERCYLRSWLHCVQSWMAGSVKPVAYNYTSSMAFKGEQITAAYEGGILFNETYLCSELPIVLIALGFPRLCGWSALGSLGFFESFSCFTLSKWKDLILYNFICEPACFEW